MKNTRNMLLKMTGYPSLIRKMQAPVVSKMLELSGNEKVLDLGCESGYFTSRIAKNSNAAVGIDLEFKSTPFFTPERQANVFYAKSDAQNLPFPPEKFDRVLLSSVLQMVKKDRALLRECHRVLKCHGLIVLSVPTEYCCLRKLNDIKPQLRNMFGAKGKAYYSLSEVKHLLQMEGFQILEVKYAPKQVGSLIYEIELYFWYRFNSSFLTSLLFPVLYSFSYLDRFASEDQIGNEVVVKAQKVST